jgi:hypothetical protein
VEGSCEHGNEPKDQWKALVNTVMNLGTSGGLLISADSGIMSWPQSIS